MASTAVKLKLTRVTQNISTLQDPTSDIRLLTNYGADQHETYPFVASLIRFMSSWQYAVIMHDYVDYDVDTAFINGAWKKLCTCTRLKVSK